MILGRKKPETSPYRMCKLYFDTLNHSGISCVSLCRYRQISIFEGLFKSTVLGQENWN